MSATKETPAQEAPAEPTAPARGGLKKAAMIGGPAVLGLAMGALILGPKLSAAPESAAPSHGAEAQADGDPGEHAESKLVRVDNVVVNPAGSEGMRFVMASVAFEVSDPAAEGRLRGAEVQVRDAISSVFERQTMAQLTQDGARDSLRVELAAAVAPFIKGASVKIYLPQFVIQ